MNSAADSNRKHLLKWWIPILVFLAFVTFGMIAGLTNGVLRRDSTPFMALTVAISVATFSTIRARRRATAFFKEPTPDRAIAHYHRSTKRIPNGKAMAAYLSAFAAVIYGQFSRARDELAAVNWNSLPPMYQAFELYIQSLLAIFEVKDYPRALSLAEQSRELGDIRGNFPGAGRGREAADANIAICELLMGKKSSELLNQLDTATQKLPGVAPAIAAWALARHYNSSGDPGKAEKYTSLVRRLLPYSILLKNLDFRQQASTLTA